MKNIPQIALLITLVLSSCTLVSPFLPASPKNYGGGNDYAVGEAQPYPQEVKLAEQRLVNFIRRADPEQRQLLDQHPYVAVQAYELVAGEIWPLERELASGRVRTMDYVQDQQNIPNYPVEFLLLFDQRTQTSGQTRWRTHYGRAPKGFRRQLCRRESNLRRNWLVVSGLRVIGSMF